MITSSSSALAMTTPLSAPMMITSSSSALTMTTPISAPMMITSSSSAPAMTTPLSAPTMITSSSSALAMTTPLSAPTMTTPPSAPTMIVSPSSALAMTTSPSAPAVTTLSVDSVLPLASINNIEPRELHQSSVKRVKRVAVVGTGLTDKNFCMKDWLEENPNGLKDAFEKYFKALPEDVRKTYKDRASVAQKAARMGKNSKKKAPQA